MKEKGLGFGEQKKELESLGRERTSFLSDMSKVR
jgi:hypothetical protein